MPAPLIHVALAIIAMNGPCSKSDKKSFIIGTCFPDIRYLNVIEREKTHVKDITWSKLLEEKNSFKLGCLFHSYVDHLFNEFVIKHNVYEKLPKSKFTAQSFKLFADKILHKQLQHQLPEIVNYLNDVTPEELAFGIERKSIEHWHNYLKKYFSAQHQFDPCDLAEEFSLRTDSIIESISTIMLQMNNSHEAKKYALNFYNFASKQIIKQKNTSYVP